MISETNQGASSLAVKLVSTDRYVKKSHWPKIRLFFQLIGLGGGDVEKVSSLVEFHSILSSNGEHKHRALETIQYILTFIGVGRAKLIELDSATMEECKAALAYPSAVVGVCNDVSEEDFKKLKQFGAEQFECDPENIESIERLCLMLHHRVLISVKDVDLLVRWLDEVDRKDITTRMRSFIRSGVYEDPVADSALENGRFSKNLPIQVSEDDAGPSRGLDANRPSIVKFKIAGGPTLDVNVERDARQMPDSTPDGSQDLNPQGGGNLVHVTSFTEIKDAESDSGVNTVDRQVSATSDASDDSETKCLILETNQGSDSKIRSPTLVFANSGGLPNRGMRKSYKCLCASVGVASICLVVVVLSVAGVIGFGAYGICYSLPNKRVYATGGQTVIAAEFSSPLPLIWKTMSECPDMADYPHSNHLYLVDKNHLHQVRKKRFSARNFTDILPQPSPECDLNLVGEDLYLLIHSTVDFEICIAAEDEPGGPGTLLIFDNNPAYERYIADDDCESVRGAHTHNLNIGSFGAFECTSIPTYVSSVNGYHYIIANTPGNIQFRYRYSYEQYYLDPNDFVAPAVCSFSSEGDNLCTFNDVTSETVYAIVSVDPSEVDNSISTHICVSSQWRHKLITLVGCFGFIFIISLVIGVLTCLYTCCKICKAMCSVSCT